MLPGPREKIIILPSELATERPSGEIAMKARRSPRRLVLHRTGMWGLVAVVVLSLIWLMFQSFGGRPKNWIENLAVASERSVIHVSSGDSTGTGFVVASRGQTHLIITNRHVVSDPVNVVVADRY